MLNWKNIPYKPITNKFIILKLKLGKKIIFQLDEMN